MPAWLNQTDEGKWETAKSAVLKSCQETDPAFLSLVTAVYRQMGGVVMAGGTSEGAKKSMGDSTGGSTCCFFK
jgi:hypothetical protein